MLSSGAQIRELLISAGAVVERVTRELPKDPLRADVSLSIGRWNGAEGLAARAELANGKRDAFIAHPQQYFTFDVYGLNSEYGFDKGRMLEGFLNSWADTRGWPKNPKLRSEYLDPGFFLWVVWRELLSKEEGLDEDFTSQILHLNSKYTNPVRIDLKLGRGEGKRRFIVLTGELVKLADRTFGGVSQEWLEVFMGSKPWFPIQDGERYDALGRSPREVRCMLADALGAVVANLDSNALELLFDLTAIDLTGGEVSRSLNFGLEKLSVLTLGEAGELIVGALAV